MILIDAVMIALENGACSVVADDYIKKRVQRRCAAPNHAAPARRPKAQTPDGPIPCLGKETRKPPRCYSHILVSYRPSKCKALLGEPETLRLSGTGVQSLVIIKGPTSVHCGSALVRGPPAVAADDELNPRSPTPTFLTLILVPLLPVTSSHTARAQPNCQERESDY